MPRRDVLSLVWRWISIPELPAIAGVVLSPGSDPGSVHASRDIFTRFHGQGSAPAALGANAEKGRNVYTGMYSFHVLSLSTAPLNTFIHGLTVVSVHVNGAAVDLPPL